MVRTTVYLPVELKEALAATSARLNRSEAELIREAIEQLTRANGPRPRLPLFRSKGKSHLAENVDDALDGFGG